MSAHHGYSEPARQSDHRSEFHYQHASDLGKDGADVESSSASGAHLLNTTVKSISWTNITVKVTDRDTKQPRLILDNVEGIVNAGTNNFWVYTTLDALLLVLCDSPNPLSSSTR